MESDTGISTKCFNNIILLTDSMGIGGLCGLHYENLSSWIDFRRSSMVIPIPKTHSLRGLARSGESWLIQCCSRCSKKQQMALGFGLPDFGKKKLPKFDGSSVIHSSCSPQRQESFGICAPSSFFHQSDCCRVPIDRFRNLKRRNSGSFHGRNLA